MDNETPSEVAQSPLSNWSINGLAAAAGIPYSTLRRRFIDPGSTTMREILSLATVLNVPPSEVLSILTSRAEVDAA